MSVRMRISGLGESMRSPLGFSAVRDLDGRVVITFVLERLRKKTVRKENREQK